MMTKVYVGNIDRRTEKQDLESEFGRYGKIRQVQIWADRHPAGFAFVEFEDERDAEDAIKEMDDRKLLGSKLRVEWAKSTQKGAPRRRSPAPYRRRRSPSPRRRRSRSRSPYGGVKKSLSPRRRSPSPRRRSPSPRRRSPSPRRRSPSPRRRSPSPRRASASPRKSRTPSPR